MTREEIISGLQMTMDLIQFDPVTGNVRPIYTLNDIDKTTYVACKAAIKALKAQIDKDINVPNTDCIYRQAAIDERRYTFGNDEFSLEAAYHDCKLVFDGITDDDSFQKADTGLILYYANEIIYALHEALEGKDTNVLSNDCISRQAAIEWCLEGLNNMPSAQPELIEKAAYIRGFEQGRTQGMIDAQGGKK